VASKETLRRKKSRHNIDDTDSEIEVAAVDPMKPWLDEWNTYIQTHEIIPEGMGLVRWWGVRIFSNLWLLVLIISKD